MIERRITRQRCYKIPKEKLDLLLVKLRMSNENLIYFEAEYIFQDGNFYDVIVNTFGSYPYVENEIDKFVDKLAEAEEGLK